MKTFYWLLVSGLFFSTAAIADIILPTEEFESQHVHEIAGDTLIKDIRAGGYFQINTQIKIHAGSEDYEHPKFITFYLKNILDEPLVINSGSLLKVLSVYQCPSPGRSTTCFDIDSPYVDRIMLHSGACVGKYSICKQYLPIRFVRASRREIVEDEKLFYQVPN